MSVSVPCVCVCVCVCLCLCLCLVSCVCVVCLVLVLVSDSVSVSGSCLLLMSRSWYRSLSLLLFQSLALCKQLLRHLALSSSPCRRNVFFFPDVQRQRETKNCSHTSYAPRRPGAGARGRVRISSLSVVDSQRCIGVTAEITAALRQFLVFGSRP